MIQLQEFVSSEQDGFPYGDYDHQLHVVKYIQKPLQQEQEGGGGQLFRFVDSYLQLSEQESQPFEPFTIQENQERIISQRQDFLTSYTNWLNPRHATTALHGKSMDLNQKPYSANQYICNPTPGNQDKSCSGSVLDDRYPNALISGSEQQRNMKERLSTSMTNLFEKLTDKLTEHQEKLHNRFMQVIERMDVETKAREEFIRRESTERLNRDSIARAEERALVFTKDSLILSLLDKITAAADQNTINVPSLVVRNTAADGPNTANKTTPVEPLGIQEVTGTAEAVRWSSAEAEALTRLRISYESRFQGCNGSKSQLWEEISAMMASMGYRKNPKICKEKWDNINKYYSQMTANNNICTSDGNGSRKRRRQPRTSWYFDLLNQFYSKSSPPVLVVDNDDFNLPYGSSSLRRGNSSSGNGNHIHCDDEHATRSGSGSGEENQGCHTKVVSDVHSCTQTNPSQGYKLDSVDG